ncbi:MAG TPA: class I SAM-dependent methyltransferase [Tepidisphaeraceae bacterium]|nr:class I SAM-dependent methyltransferase [Tepidisphaeraceae bacterium]
MLDSTTRFSDRVAYYIRSRPRYPAALLRFFQDELGLLPSHAVADIGAGTGLLTELFVRNGNVTYAVEPNQEMRAAADAALSKCANYRSTRGTAEATTLADASMNFATAGQAFHWFEPVATRREFARILEPGGFVALVWNERPEHASTFAAAYEQLVSEYHADPTAMSTRRQLLATDAAIAAFFAPSSFDARRFDNPQSLDRSQLIDRLSSASYTPLPPDPRHAQMLAAANALFDRHQVDEYVVMPHDTRVFFGRLH